MRVIAIDPAPGKESTVFEGTEYLQLSAQELREYVDQLADAKESVLVCWDAPLTGPFDPASAGSYRFDFTKRPIERFFSLNETGFKTPKGISVLGYGACPHWTISRALLGLPRVGPYDEPEKKLPLKLVADSGEKLHSRKSIVEIHPGLAAWLWCRNKRGDDANWEYKGNKGREIRDEMWEIVLERSGFEDDLRQPKTDDEFDAAIGYILGKFYTQDGKTALRRSLILGGREHGAFLLPKISGLADAWIRWKDQAGVEPVPGNRSSDDQSPAAEESAGYLYGVSKVATEAGSAVRKSAASAVDATAIVAKQTTDAAGEVIARVKSGPRQALASAAALADELLATVQGLLASSLAIDLNELLQATVKGSATIYDKAMDAEYLRTSIGGGNHRMVDGGHTIAGAWQAVRDAAPDDTFVEEAIAFVESMFKDLTTPKGLPIANWDKTTYDQVANHLQSNFGIPKDWFYDINSYDAPELLAGVIGLISVILSWKEEDTEKFSKLVGNMGVAAVFSANPILLVITLTSLARAFHKAEQAGEYVEAVDGMLKGGLGTGATLAAASQVAVFGGPVGLTLLAGLATGLLVNRATKKISVVQLRQFIMERTTGAATEVRKLAELEAVQPDPI